MDNRQMDMPIVSSTKISYRLIAGAIDGNGNGSGSGRRQSHQ